MQVQANRVCGVDVAQVDRSREHIAGVEVALNLEVALNSVFTKSPGDACREKTDGRSRSSEYERKLSLVAGAHTGMEQTLQALERLEQDTYGICESCGYAIGQARLQAYPRTAWCLSCDNSTARITTYS